MFEMVYNEETKAWEQKQEPFITIEVETEEDFEFIGNAIAFYKNHINQQTNQKTNADRIRAMSDEELANELAMVAGWDREQYKKATKIGIKKVMLDWLQQPAEVDNATD